MLEELLKNYPGVERIFEQDQEKSTCLIKFTNIENAKLAVKGLNRFKVDQSGTELSVIYN
jgi:hypothetical protein